MLWNYPVTCRCFLAFKYIMLILHLVIFEWLSNFRQVIFFVSFCSNLWETDKLQFDKKSDISWKRRKNIFDTSYILFTLKFWHSSSFDTWIKLKSILLNLDSAEMSVETECFNVLLLKKQLLNVVKILLEFKISYKHYV